MSKLSLSAQGGEKASERIAKSNAPVPRRSYRDSSTFYTSGASAEDAEIVAGVTSAPQREPIKMGRNARGISINTIGDRKAYRSR